MATIRRLLCAVTPLLLSILWSVPVAGSGYWEGADRILGRPCAEFPGKAAREAKARGEVPAHEQAGTEVSKAIEAGNLEEATELAKTWIALDCFNDPPWYRLGELYIRLGRYKEAVEILEFKYGRSPGGVLEVLFGSSSQSHKYRPILTSEEYLSSSLPQRIAWRELPSAERRALAHQQLARLRGTDLPPDPFVQRPSCPGEHCGFGNWEVFHDTPIVDAPWSDNVVGVAEEDTTVLALEGEFHVLHPPAVLVIDPLAATIDWEDDLWIPDGEIVFLLDYWSEGWAGAWYKGQYLGVVLAVKDACPRGEGCWGEYIEDEEDRGAREWWFKVRLEDGTEGWSSKHRNFLTISDEYQDAVEHPEKYAPKDD